MYVSHPDQEKFTNSKCEYGQEENCIYVQDCILPLLHCLEFNQH